MRKLLISLITASLLLMTQITEAATMSLRVEGDVFSLAELAAIIAKQDGEITVLMTRKEARVQPYANVDLNQGDVIFMANGEKIQSVKQLEDIYKNLKIDEQLKIAVKRKGKPILISLNKADPEKLPKRRMKMRRIPAESQEASTVEESATAEESAAKKKDIPNSKNNKENN